MDQIIKQSWWSKNKKWTLIICFLLSVMAIILSLAFVDNPPVLEAQKLKTAKVEFGEFQEIVMANGNIEPKTTVLIDANEGGTIQEIRAEEGDLVAAGDILLVLTNEALMLDYMQRETQIVEQINNLRNTRINLHQNLRTTEDQLEDFKSQFEIVRRQFHIDSSLAASNVITKQTFEESLVNYKFLKEKVRILEKRRNDDHKYHGDQIKRIDNSIALMERNLELIREKLSEMSIKAPLSGQLNSFSLEQGQVLQQNQTVGRVDVPGKFWIRALADQHYLNRLNEGQGAVIEYDGQSYRLLVSKVLSTVENGQIEIYLDFESEAPEDLRRGQNFQVFVEVSAKNQALKLPKGSFFQSSGGQYVFVISEDGESAHKHSIQLGRQNPMYYEVSSGLSEGQEVIISSYESFKKAEEIRLSKNNLSTK
ncbi:MAG: efflux RND transporter periplasmic adaptor subunit [Vicingaceae bacterium]